MECPYLLPLPMKDLPPKEISRESYPIKPRWSVDNSFLKNLKEFDRSNANLKTGPIQFLIKKRYNMKIIKYSEEYDRLSYLKYQEGAPLEKTLQITRSNNKFIKSLDIVLTRYDEFSHKTLLSLSVNLRKLKALQQITLLFESINFSDAEFQDLSHSLNQQCLLKTLYLEFRDYCEIENGKGASSFGKCLKGLSSLQSLVLQFERSAIIQEGWRYLRQGLETLKALKYFWLDFSSHVPPDNEALRELGLSFKKLCALESLTLVLHGNNCATAQGIVQLTENFHYLRSLKSLNLNLGHFTRAKEYGFVSLSMNLQYLLNLENLTFRIHGCRSLTNSIFIHLTNTIRGFNNLQDFTLSIDTSQKVTGEGIKNFRKSLYRHPSLKRVKIN